MKMKELIKFKDFTRSSPDGNRCFRLRGRFRPWYLDDIAVESVTVEYLIKILISKTMFFLKIQSYLSSSVSSKNVVDSKSLLGNDVTSSLIARCCFRRYF